MTIDFSKLTTQKEELVKIEQNLNDLRVPGEGLTWARILEYADNYHITTDEMLNDVVANVEPSTIEMSEDQKKAWSAITAWSTGSNPFFVLRGVPGSGKSWLTAKLKDLKIKIYFTAPTNKAAKVLGNFVGSTAKTTFSQLGLRMNTDDEKLVMDYKGERPYIASRSILVVDECSMISKDLFEFIVKAQAEYGFKVFFVGDPAQLPPVGEKFSPVWKIASSKETKASLKKVMRFDNQILNLATRVREKMQAKDYTYPLEEDNDGNEGVFILDDYKDFEAHIKLDKPESYVNNKVVAWRNKTVNNYNNIIRQHLGFEEDYCVGEIVLISQPVEENGHIIANIDDEFTITDIVDTELKAGDSGLYIPIYRISLSADTDIRVNIPKEDDPLESLLTRMAAQAKRLSGRDRSEAWRKFWTVRNSFHKLRYGYAVTTHRIQGSTLKTAMVDVTDILANKNKREAYRALYVSCTRPTTALYTF